MILAFVDYENIGSLEGMDFQKYQRIFVFCGPKNSKINIGRAGFSEFLRIEIIKITTSGADNLDFHIAYYLGKFSETADDDAEFHIITRDNGFNGLVNHIRRTGRKCKKVTYQSDPNPTKAALTPCSELTITRLKAIDGRKRPRKKEKLENWIGSQCRTLGDDVDPKRIIKELSAAGLISITGADVKYQLKH